MIDLRGSGLIAEINKEPLSREPSQLLFQADLASIEIGVLGCAEYDVAVRTVFHNAVAVTDQWERDQGG